MWEKDKQLVHAYRTCMEQFLTDLKAGEEVDYESACVVEAEKLTGYTFLVMKNYQDEHPSPLSDKKQSYFNPKLPYFQDL